MSDIVTFSPVRAVDRDGYPVAGAKAYFFRSGTTTPITVYSDPALQVAHPVPLLADAAGVWPPVYIGTGVIKVVATDPADVPLPGFPLDPVITIAADASAAELIEFDPTPEIPVENVQAAIERVQQNLVAPLLAGGIGVTGNADVIANLDATNTPSGAYRFSNATAGTFPSGIVGNDGGTVVLWREMAAEAIMILTPRGSRRAWRRTLTGSAWGTWAAVTDSNDVATQTEWNNGVSTNERLISPAKLRAAVGAAIAAQAVGAVGTYAWLNPTSGSNITPGRVEVGGNLAWAAGYFVREGDGNTFGIGTDVERGSPTGTWEACGAGYTGSGIRAYSCLWKRIA